MPRNVTTASFIVLFVCMSILRYGVAEPALLRFSRKKN
jgi:hypothetical protein